MARPSVHDVVMSSAAAAEDAEVEREPTEPEEKGFTLSSILREPLGQPCSRLISASEHGLLKCTTVLCSPVSLCTTRVPLLAAAKNFSQRPTSFRFLRLCELPLTSVCSARRLTDESPSPFGCGREAALFQRRVA